MRAGERFAPYHAAQKTLKTCAFECERSIEAVPHFVNYSGFLVMGRLSGMLSALLLYEKHAT